MPTVTLSDGVSVDFAFELADTAGAVPAILYFSYTADGPSPSAADYYYTGGVAVDPALTISDTTAAYAAAATAVAADLTDDVTDPEELAEAEAHADAIAAEVATQGVVVVAMDLVDIDYVTGVAALHADSRVSAVHLI